MNTNSEIYENTENSHPDRKKKFGILYLLIIVCILCFMIYYSNSNQKLVEETSSMDGLPYTLDFETTTITTSSGTVYTFKELNKTMASDGEISWRSLPSEDSEIVVTVEEPSYFPITGQCNENGWYRTGFDYGAMYIEADSLREVDSNEIMPIEEDVSKEATQEQEILGYNEFGTPIIGYTPEGYAIVDYTESGAPIIEFMSERESLQEEETNYPLPYMINGIDTRTGDWNGDGYNDNNGHTWYKGQTWTASNGIVLKIADAYTVTGPSQMNPDDCVIIDGTENLEPGSDFLYAINELLGRLDKINVDMSGLPDIALVSSKQTSLDPNNPSYLAYKEAFDPLWKHQNGTENFSEIYMIDSNLDGTMDGIGVVDSFASLGYMWDLRYNATHDMWTLKATTYYTGLLWDSIHNSLRMVTPDADAIYDAIYSVFYTGYAGLAVSPYEVSDWIQIGNSQLRLDYSSGVPHFNIK